MDGENVKWICNIPSEFTKTLIEYDNTHNPYDAYKLRLFYRDGVYVMKSKAKYIEYMLAAADCYENTDEKSIEVCEILCEAAKVLKDKKDTEKAAKLLTKRRAVLFEIISDDCSDTNLELLNKINGLYYSVEKSVDYTVFDTGLILRKHGNALLKYGCKEYALSKENGTIKFGETQTFNGVNEFIKSALTDGVYIRKLYREIKIIF